MWPKYLRIRLCIMLVMRCCTCSFASIDMFVLRAVQRILSILRQQCISVASSFFLSDCLIVQYSHPYMRIGKTRQLTNLVFSFFAKCLSRQTPSLTSALPLLPSCIFFGLPPLLNRCCLLMIPDILIDDFKSVNFFYVWFIVVSPVNNHNLRF